MNTRRPSLGESLLSRLEARLTRRPRIGFSPAFYARFGWEDPWLADSFGGDPLQQEESFQHLSGNAFYAHLAALGRKRWWRDRQKNARLERLAGLRTAQRVRYPGEEGAGLSFSTGFGSSSLASIALSMHLPSPLGAERQPEFEDESEAPVAWYRGRDFVPARVSRRPWHSVERPGARVLRSGGRPKEGVELGPQRAMDWAGDRSIDAARRQDPLLQDLDKVSALLSTSRRRKVTRVLAESAHLPREERVVLLRRVLGGGSSARVIRFQVERGLKESPSSGIDHALSRRFSESKGLRPVLRHSPTVDWVLPQSAAERDSLEPSAETEGLSRRVDRLDTRSARQVLSRSPVQASVGQDISGEPRRLRPTQALVSRVDAVASQDVRQEPVASALRQVSPGRFEPASPIAAASYIAPLRDPNELESSETDAAPDVRSAFGERRRRVVQGSPSSQEESVVHRTPVSPPARPTRWALGRLESVTALSAHDSAVPLISSLPLPIQRESRPFGEGRVAVELRRDQAQELGIRQFRTGAPDMSLLEDSAPPVEEESESSASAWHRTPKSSESSRRRPRWDRSELVSPPAQADAPPRLQWPKPAPERPGWRPVQDDTVMSTTDHAWFRTPGGVRVRSKGFRTPDGTWVRSSSYRTPQGQRALTGLRFEPVFPESLPSEPVESPETQRPHVRVARRADWSSSNPGTQDSGVPAADFRQNLRLLSEGREAQHAPPWTERAVSGPRIRASSELIRYLVQASDPEEVIRLIVDRGQELSRESALASPVVEVIKQIKGEAVRAEEGAASFSKGTDAGRAPSGQRPSRAARRVQGFRPLRGPRAVRQNGVGDDRIMKLAGKLRSLIHLAEDQNRRDEARKHARLSADEAPEVRAAAPAGESQQASGADVQALIQEVVSAVNREMELRRERRQEDNHEPWW